MPIAFNTFAENMEKLKVLFTQHPGVTAGLLIRHAHRPILDARPEVHLTEEGVKYAEKYGSVLKSVVKQPAKLVSSPILRCHQTLNHLALGAGWGDNLPIQNAPELLGHDTLCKSGYDEAVTRDYFFATGFSNSLNLWINGSPPPFYLPIETGAENMLKFVKSVIHENSNPLYILGSHDVMLTPLIYTIFKVDKFDDSLWPEFLESILFVKLDRHYEVFWRNQNAQIPL